MYLIFTEDDGWHTNQLVDAFNKNTKDVRLIKINETSIVLMIIQKFYMKIMKFLSKRLMVFS